MKWRLGIAAALAFVAIGSGGGAQAAPASAAKTIPTRITDADFWSLINEISEARTRGFTSENLVSNERGAQQIIPKLLSAKIEDRVYMGVGPDQNFPYIIATKPKMAIIVDIRWGAVLHHLLYKSLFELSANRSEFLSRLFSKPIAKNAADTALSVDSIVNSYYWVYGDTAEYRKNKAAVWNHLTKTHKFPLAQTDSIDLFWIYDQFYAFGMSVTYSSGDANNGRGGGGNRGMPEYADIVALDDGRGVRRGYLASEANFRWMKDFETKNLLVPALGDYGGTKALRAAAAWIKDHNGVLGAFYTSNVEQYLFQQGYSNAWFANLTALPTDSLSVILRSGNVGGGGGGFGGRGGLGNNFVCPIQEMLMQVKANQINYYENIFSFCR